MINLAVFTSSNCHNCGPMKKTLETMREIYGQDLNIVYREVDTNTKNMNLAREWLVSGVPTTIIVKDGYEYGRIVGNMPPSEVRKVIEGIIQPDVLPEESRGVQPSSDTLLCDFSESEDTRT